MTSRRPGPARRIAVRGQVEHRHEADALLAAPGDAVLVLRGRPRSLVLSCPDGCGAALTVNLDGRSGPAWRLYDGPRGVTLYPSVWRDGGCRSHFILWHDRILWCSRFVDASDEPPLPDGLAARVAAVLDGTPRTAEAIAARLDAIPWEVAKAADSLAARGCAKATSGSPRLYSNRAARGREWIA